MKPLQHAIQSIKRYGGEVEDYLDIHEFLDQTKAAHPDMRHRALLHNSMGPYIAAQVFGRNFTNSDNRLVDTRQVCEDHIIEDMGFLPTVSYFLNMIPKDQMANFAHKRKEYRRVD